MVGRIKAVLGAVLALLALPFVVQAQDLSALARFDLQESAISERDDLIDIVLTISQPVPWRMRFLDAPPRLIIDTREVDWTSIDGLALRTPEVKAVRAGVFRPGWSRLVLELSGPHAIRLAGMSTGDGYARILIDLERTSAADFAALVAEPEPPEWAVPDVASLPPPVARGTGPVIVVLDPGHGGIDPGAERDGKTEAALMLTFARELKELLLRDGGFHVVMTRDDDIFVPLEERITIARAAGGHVLLSLHADALAEGEAAGATIYTLSADASDDAAAALAERHDRDDLLAGVDLSGQDDLVATVLMDMARTETTPRIDRLALALETAIQAADLKMHRIPRQQAGFSVLKSPDIPSVLVELGFMSSARDLKRLTDEDWRARMAAALRDGLKAWANEDAVLSALPRD